MDKIAQLQEKRNQLAKQVQDLAKRYNEAGNKWAGEDEAQWKRVNGEYDAVKKELEEARAAADITERAEKVREDDERSARDERERPGLGDSHKRRRTADVPTNEDRALALQAWILAANRRGDRITPAHRNACKKVGVKIGSRELNVPLLFRYGDPAWSCGGRQEMRAGLDVATTGAGKETIPAGFMAELERKLLAYGGPRSVCRVIRTDSGNSLPWPKIDDTSNEGELLGEATTVGASVDPTTSAVTFLAYKYSSKPVLASTEILEDSAFNLASEVGSILGERLGRIMGKHNTTGTGTAQPKGIVTDATAAVTAASATALTGDELMTLVHSLDPAYRNSMDCGFMMHDNIILYIRKLKDSTGQWLWQPGLQGGVPDKLLGYPVTVNQHMDSAMTTGKKVVLFGAFAKYVIRDVASLRFYRLDERYRDTDQTGFVAFMRMDSRALQSVAIRLLTLA